MPLYAYEFSDRMRLVYFPPISFAHGAVYTIDIQFCSLIGTADPWDSCTSCLRQAALCRSSWSLRGRVSWYSGIPNLTNDHPWPRYTANSKVYFSQNVPKSGP